MYFSDKFQGKFRIKSTRLKDWIYSWRAAYYITICTKGKIHHFGRIENDKMILSPIGEILNREWLKTPEIRPDMNLWLGEYVIMPNHFHAIIVIGLNEYNDASKIGIKNSIGERMKYVSTSLPNRFGPQSKNLASIVRGVKSAVTIQARKINQQFEWQSRYYDQVIRDEKSYLTISEYILNNPANWVNDDFYTM